MGILHSRVNILPPSQKYGRFRPVHVNQRRLQMTCIPLHSLSFSALPFLALASRPASTALSSPRPHRRRRGERGGSCRPGLDLGRPRLDLGRLGWILAAPATQRPSNPAGWPREEKELSTIADALLRLRAREDGRRRGTRRRAPAGTFSVFATGRMGTRGSPGSRTRHRHLRPVLVTGGGSGGAADLVRGRATSPGGRRCLDAGRRICICLGTGQVREGGTEVR
jgi:hypothetical protein